MSEADDRFSTTSVQHQWQRWEMNSFHAPSTQELTDAEGLPDPETVLRELHAEAARRGYEQGYAIGLEQGQEAGRSAGHQEGYTQGHLEGYQTGLTEAREQGHTEAQALHVLLEHCHTQIANIEEQIGQSLLNLAVQIASQVLQTTLAANPDVTLAIVHEVLRLTPGAERNMHLWVHPDDVALIEMHLADELNDSGWRVLSDPALTRGSCRAETPYGEIDATLETRWRRVIASLGRDTPLAMTADSLSPK